MKLHAETKRKRAAFTPPADHHPQYGTVPDPGKATFALVIELAENSPLAVAAMLEGQAALIREYYTEDKWLPLRRDNNNPIHGQDGKLLGGWEVA
jgi:hypothetical protein